MPPIKQCNLILTKPKTKKKVEPLDCSKIMLINLNNNSKVLKKSYHRFHY